MTVRKAALAAVTLAVSLSAAPALAQKWDLPTGYPDSNFLTKNIRQFAEEIQKGTGGKLQIVVHPANSLIKHPEIKRAVQTGQVPIGETLVSLLGNESPLYTFDSNPFLATTSEQSWKLYEAARPHLEKRLDGQGMRMLFSVAWPPSAIHTKKEINSLADLKGVKMRAYSAITMRFAELAGATPVLVTAPEVPQAFKAGIIDGQINSAAGGVDTQTWDATTHMYDVQVISPQNMVIVNKAAFGKLDAATQKLVLTAAAAAEKRGWAEREVEAKRTVDLLASKGIKIVKPSAKLQAEFAEIGRKMADEWAQKAGAEGKAILDAYNKSK